MYLGIRRTKSLGLRNDLIGLTPVSNQVVETGGVDAVRQTNGGLAAFPAAAAIVKALAFPGIKGFSPEAPARPPQPARLPVASLSRVGPVPVPSVPSGVLA